MAEIGDATGERDARRIALTDRLVDLVLRDGLGAMGLRGLAKALDTSDRMLLYYFGTKDALVVAVIGRIVARLLDATSSAAEEASPPDVFLLRALATAQAQDIRPFVNVLSDVIARGGQGEAPYDSLAPDLVARWLDFIRVCVIGADEDPSVAPAILAIVEGVALLERANPGSAALVGPKLAAALATERQRPKT
ncbi:TetR/AcrR family transcriptional regulator [Acetobacter sacchari]|uniref:TetR/AcrR family transcriptional regulator n=1 Tax=Acetobacter sacchari TaxID=2661687 RepID=A0ABS3LS76_9PROT|nr:TetR/AcrR family transcriptional regulator [Acetobacter sacchari]MBO1358756.1 TetR/AcrR family transcriptional regulator [Acetobacter sacchari]